jgi:putative peptide zinc metalloprotease protein
MSDVNRPLPIRKRSDLIAERLRFGPTTSWIVKDPLALRFFRFQEEEYSLLSWLDGRWTLTDLRDAFEARFAPRRIRPESILQFVAQLHRQGLVVSDAPDQGPRLLERRAEQRRRQALQRWSNPLAVRFRGIDPQWMLDRGYPWVRWMFRRTTVCVCIAAIIAASSLVAVKWHAFLEKLPSHQQFFTPSSCVLLLAALGGVKVLHEFGHGFSCRHFSGRCHALGAMFLVFTPCLYCDVTDSWRFTNKWHRIMVSAAGMYVELVLASLATFAWWFSSPGLVHHLCLSVMFVCSVNTLLFNGNPLLRYDGYYMLADFVEVPNLAAKASSVSWAFAERLICGPPEVDDRLLPQANWLWFCLYHVAATLYRWTLTLAIMVFLMHLARPYHLENVVRMMGLVAVASLLIGPVKRLYRWATVPGGRNDVRKPRAALVSGVIVALLALVVFLPLPKRVWGTVEIEPQNSQRVYVDVPGRLIEQIVRPGAIVQTGDVVARLANVELELQIADVAAQCRQLKGRLDSLQREQFSDPTAALRMPELRQSLAAAQKQLGNKQEDLERLSLRALRDGTVLPGPAVPAHAQSADRLRDWTGRPHDRDNVGCSLATGTLYCEIGDPRRWQALIVVDQDDLPFIRLGSPVEIKLDELPDIVFHGVVDEIAERELTEAPKHLSNKAGGDIATETNAAGVEVPLAKSYQVQVAFEDSEGLVRLGLRGSAKIHVDWEPLGRRIARWCLQTFHLKL